MVAEPSVDSGRIRIDSQRLLADLRALRTFGARGTGVVRPAFSEADVESRRWLQTRYREAGLSPIIDRYGNVFGRDPSRQRALLVGSHGDTQPTGGWLDGALGVIYGLEIARAVQESGLERSIGVDAVCWNDEEGRFVHFLGCRAYCGCLPQEEVEFAVDANGVRLIDAIAQAGYGEFPMRPVDPSRHVAYLEGHIEQGPVLHASGLQLAAVSAIVGAREFLVTFSGEANHAGTTPMNLRKDAVRALIYFAASLDGRFRAQADGEIVWTFGRIEVKPNAPSIVPAAASISIQFRAPTLAALDRFEKALRDTVAEHSTTGGASLVIKQILDYRPTQMDAVITETITRALERVSPKRWRILHSGAGHDAQFLAQIMPTGMLFVPSIDGISHSFEEDTAEQDLVAGCCALARVVEDLIFQGA